MTISDRQQRYKECMQRKKKNIDKSIKHAVKERGLVLTLTGNGKGKSSSAFGMVARALGHGMKVGVGQFIKGRTDTGEENFFSSHQNVLWKVLGEGFTWETQNLSRDAETAQNSWEEVKEMLMDPTFDLVVLDELTYPINYRWLELENIILDLQNRPYTQHVVITGRNASMELCEFSDTVTEMGDIKHAFRVGVKAQKGIDW